MNLNSYPKDPRIDLIRPEFLNHLSRLCLLLALGHFLSLIPLFLMSKDSAILAQYTNTITGTGILLALLGIFAQKTSHRRLIAFLSVGTLWAQTISFTYSARTLDHSSTFIFPILSFIATPMMGRRWAYGIATLSILALTGIGLHFSQPLTNTCFLSGAILFSAYVSETMWRGVLRREERLKELVSELHKKNKTIEDWASSLFTATSQSGSTGHLSLPPSPPYAHFAALTQYVGELQERVKKELSQTLLKDRLDTIGLLASGLAHELNTPLTSLEFLLESAKPSLSPQWHKEMQEEIGRMSKITREFLQFARSESTFEILDLNEVVRTSLPFLNRFHQFNLQIITELSPGEIWIEGNLNQLQQMIVNLFKNAADATPHSKGRFTVTTQENALGHSILKLSDNGSGIPPNNLSQIFDPFFTTKEPGKGTGLGLFLVQEIASRHSAKIHVESTPNIGTLFTIVFPKAKVVSQRKAA